MATLSLNLKGEYFDQIKAGDKKEEFRLYKPFWYKRLKGRHYDQIVLLRGYPPKGDENKRLCIPYRGYKIKTITHPHFGPHPVTVYAIDVSGGDDRGAGHQQLALF